MSKERILVVDDEESILELIDYNLSKEGWQVECAASGELGLKRARSLHPDLVVLDLMLPGLDGLEVCKALKADPQTSRIPVLMLTAKGEDSDVITGLELGADDYITKPFSPKVLIARIRAALRRARRPQLNQEEELRVHELTIDPARLRVLVADQPVELTVTEFRILYCLAAKPGWVFTRDQIIDAVHGKDYAITDRAVDVQIVALRRKLGPAGQYIETVRGIGYRLRD